MHLIKPAVSEVDFNRMWVPAPITVNLLGVGEDSGALEEAHEEEGGVHLFSFDILLETQALICGLLGVCGFHIHNLSVSENCMTLVWLRHGFNIVV